jgi:hypothetical protein
MKSKLKYKGIEKDSTIQWRPTIYDDPFKFDYDTVKTRIETAEQAGFTDDVATIKKNIKRVVADNPGMFDDFLELV